MTIPSANVQNIEDDCIRLPTPYYVCLYDAYQCRDNNSGEYVHFRVVRFEMVDGRVARIHVVPYDTVNQQWLDSTHVCLEPPFNTGLEWRTFGLSYIPALPAPAPPAGGTKRKSRKRNKRKSRRRRF